MQTPYSTTALTQAQGEEACYGYARELKRFGLTTQTEKLLEKPHIQKKLLRGEVPFQCEKCFTLFFVERAVLAHHERAFSWASLPMGRSPQILCINAYWIIDYTTKPPALTINKHRSCSTIIFQPEEENIRDVQPSSE